MVRCIYRQHLNCIVQYIHKLHTVLCRMQMVVVVQHNYTIHGYTYIAHVHYTKCGLCDVGFNGNLFAAGQSFSIKGPPI